MTYTVRAGDTLWRIAWLELGDPHRWVDVAQLNLLRHSDRLIVGQRLLMPLSLGQSRSSAVRNAPATIRGTVGMGLGPYHPSNLGSSIGSFEKRTPLLPARAYVFFIVDEFNPLTKKLTRRVGVSKHNPMPPEIAVRVLAPEKYGLTARVPNDTQVTVGEHVMENNRSRFTSASQLPGGSTRFEGRTIWIDVRKMEAAGVILHREAELQADLDRLRAEAKDPSYIAKLDRLRALSRDVDKEVLLEGYVPPAAIKGGTGGTQAGAGSVSTTSYASRFTLARTVTVVP